MNNTNYDVTILKGKEKLNNLKNNVKLTLLFKGVFFMNMWIKKT